MKRQLVLFGLLAGLAFAVPAHASTAYSFSVDTSALAGSVGNLDFSFIGLADAPAASASLSFLTGGSSAGSAVLDGEASATPSGWLLGNGTAFNAVWQPWNFGQQLSFSVRVDGDYSAAASGTTFSFRLWNAAGTETLLTADPSGDFGRVEMLTGNVVSASALGNAASISAVPEPDALLMAAVGLALVGWVQRRRVLAAR